MIKKFRIYYFICTLAFVVFASTIGISQKNLRISIFNEATTLPSSNILHFPIHPGFSIGTDIWIKSGKHWHRSIGAEASFFHHRLSENALMIDATYAIGYKFKFGLQPKLLTSIGYKQSFAAGEIYEIANGDYISTNPAQKSQINVKVGYGVEYSLNERLSLVADYRIMVASPFSELLPFMLHNFFSLGVKVNFTKL